MKYDLRKIMLRAWKIYRENKELSFGECLHRAWLSAKAEEVNAKRIEAAKATAWGKGRNKYMEWMEEIRI